MAYVACLHCERKFPQPSTRRTCSVLCKNAVDKHAAKLRLAEDTYHATHHSQPTYILTEYECLAIEARLAGSEVTVFDSFHGFAIKDAHQETGSANANELHDSWADKGAALDVWRLRRVDRGRFGGIVLTAELAAELETVRLEIWNREFGVYLFEYDPANPSRVFDGLNNPEFHLKLFDFELDELADSEGDQQVYRWLTE